MVIEPRLYLAKVMHKRIFPKENTFYYNLYYLALPLPAQPIPGFLTSFYPKDLGSRDGNDPFLWVKSILSEYNFNEEVSNIILITMPRVMGYVFNPISFYLCIDKEFNLLSVLCEVHNTFGEQHNYLCAHPDHRPMTKNDSIEAEKVFHVSPFLEREGRYTFRFDLNRDNLNIWIDYYNKLGQKQLVTSLVGHFSVLNKSSLRSTFWRHPLVTMKVIFSIHWQALRLILNGIRHIPKPEQYSYRTTGSRNLEKRKG